MPSKFVRGSGFQLESINPPDYEWAPLTEAEVAAHVSELQTQGYTILKHAIEPSVLAEAHQASIDLYRSEGVGKTGGRYTERNGETAQFLHTNIIGKDQRYWPLLANTNMLRVVRGLLGEDALLSNAVTRWSRPGCSEQGFHTDDLSWGRDLFPRPLKKQIVCTSIVATQDFTIGNGATKVFPYSHTWEELPEGLAQDRLVLTGGEMGPTGLHPKVNLKSEEWARANGKPAPFRAEMPAGSVFIWAGGVWHAGGAYTDKAGPDRAGIIFSWCNGSLRPAENWNVQHPVEMVGQMPMDCQRVLGYAMGGPYFSLGRVNSNMGARVLGEGGKELAKWQRENALPETYQENQRGRQRA